MPQCQSNPDGRCTMEPPCPPGECYVYSVVSKEHGESQRVTEDPGLARLVVESRLPYRRGPYTEKEPWDRSALGLINAVLDTAIPGARLIVETDPATGEPTRVAFGRCEPWDRPRDMAACLRELAGWLDGTVN